MRLSQQLRQQFENFDHAAPDMSGLLAASNESGQLSYQLDAYENIACGVRSLRMDSPLLADADSPKLRDIGNTLVSRVTYLLEPLALVECDVDGTQLQIRSTQPSHADDGVSYYELLLASDGVSLCRYTKPASADREMTASQLTREVMLRLADDLEDAITS